MDRETPRDLTTVTLDTRTAFDPMCETLTAKALLATEAEHVTEHTQPVQLVLGSPTGCEATLHTACRCLRCVLPLHSESFHGVRTFWREGEASPRTATERKTLSHTKVSEIPTDSFIFVDLISPAAAINSCGQHYFPLQEQHLFVSGLQHRDLKEGRS